MLKIYLINEEEEQVKEKSAHLQKQQDITFALAKGATDISELLDAKLIVVGTESGRSARDIRRYFPKARILAITNNEKTANQLVLIRGVESYIDPSLKTLDEFYKAAKYI